MAMWNNLLKLSLISYIWKRYKRTLIAFPILLLYFWVISLVHQDFLQYTQLKGSEQGVGLSFIVKWLFMLLGVGVFVFLHINSAEDSKPQAQSTQDKRKNSKTTKTTASVHNDAFANIRKKEKLKSKADKVIDDK